jgi:hypothetical protein
VLSIGRRIRDLPGVILKDLPRYRRALGNSGAGHSSDRLGWISLCNRSEELIASPDEHGVVCSWWEGSTLHAPEVIPALGRQIMSSALEEWPIEFQLRPHVLSTTPSVSFIFTHAGPDRLPQLILTIASIRAQRGVRCECIVVDQSLQPIADQLPGDVRYLHLDTSSLQPGWRKAWGYNVGARLAQADVLIFQDGDVCVPATYTAEVLAALARPDVGAASLQRFLFYLDGTASNRVTSDKEIPRDVSPQTTRQNWKGGTIAIRKDAFHAIGGFDEGFVDWGGEDDEFYDRCAEIGHCRSGYLPFVHLWHTPQPVRKMSTNPNIADVMPWRMAMSYAERIAELCQRRWGDVTAPDPLMDYKTQRRFV